MDEMVRMAGAFLKITLSLAMHMAGFSDENAKIKASGRG
jgi:hypothetical protein